MDALRSGVFLLFGLLPVCSAETFFTHPHICYFLDAFLTLYCIIATGLFFKEKFATLSLTDEEPKGDKDCIYQELDRAKDTDPYDVLQSSKGKKVSNSRLLKVTFLSLLGPKLSIDVLYLIFSRKKLPRKINLSRPKMRRMKIPTSLRWPHLPSNPRSETTIINRSKRTSTILMINDCLSDKSRKKCKIVIYMKLLKKDDCVIV